MNVHIQATRTKKGAAWHTSDSYDARFVDSYNGEEHLEDRTINVEEEALSRWTLDQVASHPALTVIEQELVAIMAENPTGTLLEWGSPLGMTHHMEVSRLLKRIGKKVRHLIPFAVEDLETADHHKLTTYKTSHV